VGDQVGDVESVRGGDRTAAVRSRDQDGAARIFDRYATLIRFENQALINLPIRKLVYQRRGAQYNAEDRKLRFEGSEPVPAEALLAEPGAALFRVL